MDNNEKTKLLLKAENYDKFKDEIGKDYVNNIRYLKTDLSSWFNALTAASFTVGAIAITIGADKTVNSGISHPSYFWCGTFLLILDGVLIFFLKKHDIENNLNEMPQLIESKADYWELRNLTIEKSNGNNLNSDRLKTLEKNVVRDYEELIKKWSWYKWIKKTLQAATTDIVFGLFLFPIILMLSQIINKLHIQMNFYTLILQALLILYIIYTLHGGIIGVKAIKKQQAAEQRIKELVIKK